MKNEEEEKKEKETRARVEKSGWMKDRIYMVKGKASRG